MAGTRRRWVTCSEAVPTFDTAVPTGPRNGVKGQDEVLTVWRPTDRPAARRGTIGRRTALGLRLATPATRGPGGCAASMVAPHVPSTTEGSATTRATAGSAGPNSRTPHRYARSAGVSG